jgi:hypothetical protein
LTDPAKNRVDDPAGIRKSLSNEVGAFLLPEFGYPGLVLVKTPVILSCRVLLLLFVY